MVSEKMVQIALDRFMGKAVAGRHPALNHTDDDRKDMRAALEAALSVPAPPGDVEKLIKKLANTVVGEDRLATNVSNGFLRQIEITLRQLQTQAAWANEEMHLQEARADRLTAQVEPLEGERDAWQASATEFKGLTEEWQAAAEAAVARAAALEAEVARHRKALEEVASCEQFTRSGGATTEDLSSYEQGLQTAISVAISALDARTSSTGGSGK